MQAAVAKNHDVIVENVECTHADVLQYSDCVIRVFEFYLRHLLGFDNTITV